jgi:uncharacterized repeat protein (TIGR01451 family)
VSTTAQEVLIEKRTDGQDADSPPGPTLTASDPVSWTYAVANASSRDLVDIVVIDDQGVTVSCPATNLGPGESMTCTASGTVVEGQYANVGTVTAEEPDGTPVEASDPSHYFGQPALTLEKSTEGFDADFPPGPSLPVGGVVAWEYRVTNVVSRTVSGISVTDDQGVVVTCPDTTLGAGESMTCTASGTVEPGQYANLGTATGELAAPGGTVSASDPSHYFGLLIGIEKATNGEDADTPRGPTLPVGHPVAWTYVVTNFSDETVTDVTVGDDQGVAVTCPETALGPGESMTCTASGTVELGQYANLGTVTATHSSGQVADSDPSHYFGQGPALDFGDAPDPPYPTRLASNGARHQLSERAYLGACVDAEIDGQPSAAATGDDGAVGFLTVGTCAVAGDDEDGVVFPAVLVPGETGEVEVTAHDPCTLSAWIDFNADGDWNDPGETLFPGGTALAAGSNPLSFPVPAGAVAGNQAARFRCTTDGETTPAGEASDGEVEDYLVLIGVPAIAATKTVEVSEDVGGDGGASPGDTLLYTVVVTNEGEAAAHGVVLTDTPDANTELVVGSVTTSAGTVVSGNTAGDTSVEVDIGTLAAGASVTITFEVVIDEDLPPGVTEIVNQGLVAADSLDDVPTDDPAQPGPDDPTSIVLRAPAVTEIPSLSAWGAAALALLLTALAWRRLGGAA